MDKNKIINEFSKESFTQFLEYDTNGNILKLLDGEGTDILSQSKLKEERINYILSHSPFINEIFKNEKFLELFLNCNIRRFYAVISNLSIDTELTLFKKAIELNKDSKTICELFCFFNDEGKLSILNDWHYSNELLYGILKRDYSVKAIKNIIENFNIDLLNYDIDLKNLFEKLKSFQLNEVAKRNSDYEYDLINIPPQMINNKVAEILFEKYDVFTLRSILNDMEYCCYTGDVNNYIQKKEDALINNVNQTGLIGPFNEIFEIAIFYKNKLEEMNHNKENDEEDSFNMLRFEYNRKIQKYFKVNNLTLDYDQMDFKNNIDDIKKYLIKLSNRYLSNYIIDYHFKENYYNVHIDVGELLNFFANDNIELSNEKVELYKRIYNIDNLSSEEKLKLHNELKQINMVEEFYDDMSYARHLVGESLRDYSLSSESVKDYRDDELSQKYGVDVYNLSEKPFFGIVKTNRNHDDMPTGHSFSLVGMGATCVYGDAEDDRTYLYDASMLNPDQVVHVFPYDSFTLYKPFGVVDNPSMKVDVLMNPYELIEENSHTYNEILLLEQGRIKTDIDAKIPELQRIALYCLDNITEKEIETAKAEGVGIVFIDTKKYKEFNDYYMANMSKEKPTIDSYNYNYYNAYDADKFAARR